jgi:hypothetical protein
MFDLLAQLVYLFEDCTTDPSVVAYIKLFDAQVDAYCSMEPYWISVGAFCVHALPCASTFNTFGVYLVLGRMLRYGKLIIHLGS